MQGNDVMTRRHGRQFVLILAATHVAAAGLAVFLIAELGRAATSALPTAGLIALVAPIALVGAALDLRAIIRGSFSVGPHRQTPKALWQQAGEWWVAPLLWGADTGLIWTTYRVSFCSWLLLLLAAIGIAPAWSGLIYGLALAIPLSVVVSVPRLGFANPTSDRPRAMSPRLVQAVGVGSMVLISAWTVAVSVG